MPNPAVSMEALFHPRAIAFVGVTLSKPDHWTRTLLNGILKFEWEKPLYLVNPRGGELLGHKVWTSLEEIPGPVDYVIATVPAPAAKGLVAQAATKGAHFIHFCTSGFSETGQADRIVLEKELLEEGRHHDVRLIGPNCLGLYCPESRLSFNVAFPRDPGGVAFLSQSGGNAIDLIRQAGARGVRFSKSVSYGNACDLNESDFLEYLADDPSTRIIALYVEGVRDGVRFRRALERASATKPVVLLKAGVGPAGRWAASSHTASLAGEESTWTALCRQLNIIRVRELDEMVDVLVALNRLGNPRGKRAAMVGAGGGAAVLITDGLEANGIQVPQFPRKIIDEIASFTEVAGNMFGNPLDYSQSMADLEKLERTTNLIARWEGADFLLFYLRPALAIPRAKGILPLIMETLSRGAQESGKPKGIILSPSIYPEDAEGVFELVQLCDRLGMAVFFSFSTAAQAISRVADYYDRRS
jgi:acyl-CoA synthetase (NDP forming)